MSACDHDVELNKKTRFSGQNIFATPPTPFCCRFAQYFIVGRSSRYSGAVAAAAHLPQAWRVMGREREASVPWLFIFEPPPRMLEPVCVFKAAELSSWRSRLSGCVYLADLLLWMKGTGCSLIIRLRFFVLFKKVLQVWPCAGVESLSCLQTKSFHCMLSDLKVGSL